MPPQDFLKQPVEQAPINDLVAGVRELQDRGTPVTLLAVCPNSDTVLEAAIVAASRTAAPMLFATTLNQVDRDGGYTGWTPDQYVARMNELAQKHSCSSPLYPCLDHGGPWLKDAHATAGLGLEEAMAEVKSSITACLQAGYALLHLDPTVDRTLAHDGPLDIRIVAERTAELLEHAEAERQRLGLSPVSYEVGTEEVAGGLADIGEFRRFVDLLEAALKEHDLMDAWPSFIVGKVGTDLHTAVFDPEVSAQLRSIVAPYGSLVKGHYTDWVDNPEAYPASGMGGANVGPEFTVDEANALRTLRGYEEALGRSEPIVPSRFFEALTSAVVDSQRWRKWLQPNEPKEFESLDPERRLWLVTSGARYVWTEPSVMDARTQLYENLKPAMGNPHAWVVERVASSVEKYIGAFNLFGAARVLAARRTVSPDSPA